MEAMEQSTSQERQGNVLKIAGLVALIGVAAIASKLSCSRVADNSGYKPAEPLTIAQQRQLIEDQVKGVEANQNMAPEAKAMTINMIKSHAPKEALPPSMQTTTAPSAGASSATPASGAPGK